MKLSGRPNLVPKKWVLSLTLGICMYLLAGSLLVAQDLKKIVIGVTTLNSINVFPLVIAKEFGYFRTEGFLEQLVSMNSDLSVKALVTGDVGYATSTTSVAKAAAVGFPVKILMSFFNGSDYSIVTNPAIKTASDLKGKVFAISRFGSAVDFDLRAGLRHLGLDPARDVKIIPVGAGDFKLVALLTGRVDGAVLNGVETLFAVEQGMKIFMGTGQLTRQTLTGLGTSILRIQKNREEVSKVTRAVHRALVDYRENKEKIKPLFIRTLKIKPEHFDWLHKKSLEAFSPDGSLTEEDVKAAYDSARQGVANLPTVQLSDLFDLSVSKQSQAK
jgi:ABC-type nitrate/sulfonate/bicarbonate transport system substrate-binding protein